MNLIARLAFAGLVLASAGTARDVAQEATRSLAGVRLPEKIQIGPKEVVLNGMGLRTRTIFNVKVYVAGLYLEQRSRDSAQVIAGDAVKRVDLTFLRDLDRSQISDAITEGFERNSKADLPALRARLGQLQKMIRDVKQGDRMQITYLPGRGTLVAVRGEEHSVIEGKDFADALFSVWLGRDPVDKELKASLLGAG